ncbi:MAG: hypothetical protein A2Y38_12700 [Spirochaetes bacterium GWB1_59_5]|nr:MAG: hypothetical protein A2Y38_12700 [Spirochaetes bacterium GWB1_59_5]
MNTLSFRPVRSSLIPFAVLFAILLVVTSCAKKTEARFPPLTLAEANAEAVWKRIKVDGAYEDWAFWPGHEGAREGQAPHGPYHRIYVNADLFSGLPSSTRTAPEGSIIVKENMNADQKITAITLMAKIKGFDPANGDWFWARYDLAGKSSAAGKVNGCINCHAGMKDNDFVIVRALDAK